MLLSDNIVRVGARDSALSKAQVAELLCILQNHYPSLDFSVTWFQTTGDVDQTTSLSSLEKTDFFTKEIDRAVLDELCQIGVHSAKDLPDPLPQGLIVLAYTESIDPSDVIVLKDHQRLENLPFQAKVGTSSLRRAANIKALRSDLECIEIRGPIEKRLSLLDEGKVDAVVIAKAALIRLKLQRNTIHLPGEPCPRQGSLAIVSKENNFSMEQLFACLPKSCI